MRKQNRYGKALANNAVPVLVNAGVLFNSGLHFGIMIPADLRTDFHFQTVLDIGNGAFGQKPGGKHPVAFVIVDVL